MHSFEKINDEIYLLKIPFSIVWTGSVLIIDKESKKKYLIDSGNDDPDKYIVPALKEMGIEPESIDYLLNTHCHGDHIGGHIGFVKKYHVKIVTFEGGAERLKNPAQNAVRIRTKFPEHSPAPQSWLEGVDADILVKNNGIFDNRLMLVHTPGHDDDCVCWYDLKTKYLITGDSLQANGTPTQGIGFYQSLASYKYSLNVLKDMDIEGIIAGHEYDGIGSVIKGKEKVNEALLKCFDYVEKYDEFIKRKAESGETDPAKIAVDLITEMGCGMPEKLFLALYTVNEHLNDIKKRGNAK